jgi:rRNA maturation endonuclease Nob1
MICEKCGKDKPDVEYVEDPYDKEIEDVSNWKYLCDNCYDEISWDI